MQIGYYPGCSQTGTAKEYDKSLRLVMNKLSAGILELNDWSCCGATSAHVTSHRLSLALSGRNLALAEKQGFKEMLAPCAACYNRLLISQHELNNSPKVKADIEEIVDCKIKGDTEIINIIQLFQKIGKEKISENIKNDLSILKAACYYGCLLVRPHDITHFDDAEEPVSMEELVKTVGAETVNWNFKTECCGAAHSVARKEIVVNLSKKIIEDARTHGANVIIVACPMCHTNLDMRQRAMKREYKDHSEMPVLYLPELIGLAMGFDNKQLGIDLHTVKFKFPELVKKSEEITV